MSDEVYDVIIIGGGPAGLAAAIYTARHKLKTMVLEGNNLGGKALDANRIENYPGFPEGIKGKTLMKRFIKQMKSFNPTVNYETVIGLNDWGNLKIVQTRSGFHQCKAVIISTGVSRKQLSIPGENEFKGRGVSYCAVCDGPFFEGKVVAVVGSGSDALHDVEILAETASKVYAIPGKKNYSEDFPELRRIREHPRVEIITGADVREIGGKEFVEFIQLDGSKTEKLHVDGVFIVLEHVSSALIFSEAGIKTDESGCITVDLDQQTNIEGVFAAGDCSCRGMQIVTATGMGAKAALSAMRYIKSRQ